MSLGTASGCTNDGLPGVTFLLRLKSFCITVARGVPKVTDARVLVKM